MYNTLRIHDNLLYAPSECTLSVTRLPARRSVFIATLFLVVSLAVVVLILEEEVLVAAVAGEQHRCCAQAREAALEAVEAREGSLVSPCLTVRSQPLVSKPAEPTMHVRGGGEDERSLPGVISRLSGRLLQVPHVEAGDVALDGAAAGGSQYSVRSVQLALGWFFGLALARFGRGMRSR